MSKSKWKFFGYYLGIGLGIIFVTAFITSQIVIPLFFSRPKSIQVPNLYNLEVEKAKTILLNNKLHYVLKDSVYAEDIDKGKIVSQKPEPDTYLRPDGTVYLIISKGSKYVRVPELTGLDVQSAWIVLKNNGLRFTIADSVYSDFYPREAIVQSIPAYGERVQRNTKVKLYISRGPSYTSQSDTLDTEYYDNY